MGYLLREIIIAITSFLLGINFACNFLKSVNVVYTDKDNNTVEDKIMMWTVHDKNKKVVATTTNIKLAEILDDYIKNNT